MGAGPSGPGHDLGGPRGAWTQPIQTPDKTNFRGALRYAPLQIFGPTLRSSQIFVARAARAKEKISREIPPSTRAESPAWSGADRNSQKNDLLLACFWPRPNVVSRAARIHRKDRTQSLTE